MTFDRQERTPRARWTIRGVALGGIVAGALLIPIATDRTGTPHPLPFALAILLGAVAACIVAVSVGLGALRVKGLMLAVSTMAFAIAAESYIFQRPLFDPDGTNSVSFTAESSSSSTSRIGTARTTTSRSPCS